jgi:hypothetical protein
MMIVVRSIKSAQFYVSLSNSFNQIGRTGRLSPNKTSHFQLLHEESGIPYGEMLFFDVRNTSYISDAKRSSIL